MSPPESAAVQELARFVRDARPRPRNAWAAQLDARVADGFPRKRPRLRLPVLPRPPLLLPALGPAVCLIAAIGVAVSLRGGRDHGSTPAASGREAAPLTVEPRTAEKGAAGAPDAVV